MTAPVIALWTPQVLHRTQRFQSTVQKKCCNYLLLSTTQPTWGVAAKNVQEECFDSRNPTRAPHQPANTWPRAHRRLSSRQCFQTMPAYKSQPQSSPTHFAAVPLQFKAGPNHRAGLTFGKQWDLQRMWPWSMKQRGIEEDQRAKQIHCASRGLAKATFPDAKRDIMTGFWLGLFSAGYCDKGFV